MKIEKSKQDGATVHIHIALAHEACAAASERYIGLSVPRWRVLHYLSEVGTATQKEICQRIELDGWAVTRAVKPLEQQGLIQRHLDPEDNRMTRVVITDAGRDWYAKARVRRAAFLKHALHGLSEEELDVLEALLIRIENNIENEDLAAYPSEIPGLSLKSER